MSQSVNRRRVAAVGAGVGVAAASVITMLVIRGDSEPTEDRSPQVSFIPPAIPRTLPDAALKPYPARDLPSDATSVSDAKAKADAKKAAAEAARQNVIAQARTAGVLGKGALTNGGAFASLTGSDDNTIYGGLVGNQTGDINSGYGYGRSGFGPGGGAGWGTIGTGRYGTIGRGTGTGSGRLGGASKTPTVVLGQSSVSPKVASAADPGALDTAIVRRYLKRNIQKVRYCYEKALLTKPGLQGTVSVAFAIEDSGMVTNGTASGVDGEVASCINGVLSAIEFPKPKGVGGVKVATAFTFRPGP